MRQIASSQIAYRGGSVTIKAVHQIKIIKIKHIIYIEYKRGPQSSAGG